MNVEIVLQANNIKKVYGTKGHVFTALNNIDLEVNKGEFLGIMGASGAGKSTLLNILSTIDIPSGGTIHVNNKNILNLSEDELSTFRRDQLGFIFQDFHLLDTLTVKENILLPLSLAGINASDMEARLQPIAEIFGIEQILNQYPYQISGGQQQRTATARAIINEPSLVFADEPTGSLDSKSAFNLLQTLTKLNEQRKATILMVTHDSYAASFCTRVLFIKDGSIFTEIRKGDQTRKQFFQQIIDVLTTLGGGHHDVI